MEVAVVYAANLTIPGLFKTLYFYIAEKDRSGKSLQFAVGNRQLAKIPCLTASCRQGNPNHDSARAGQKNKIKHLEINE
jgi:hypothetical protein